MGKIVAAILSALIPGLGQFYNGQLLKGIGLLVVYGITVSITFFSLGILFFIPLIIWAYGIYDAYTIAKNKK